MYTSCCWNCNFIFVRSFENSCLVREYGSTEQFEKNYRSARGPRETFATNWLPGYPRATVLRTCSPLLRRRNFVKSLELLRIMRTTSLSLSKLSLISNCFQSSPPPFRLWSEFETTRVATPWTAAAWFENEERKKKKLEYNGITGEKKAVWDIPLSDNGVILKDGEGRGGRILRKGISIKMYRN